VAKKTYPAKKYLFCISFDVRSVTNAKPPAHTNPTFEAIIKCFMDISKTFPETILTIQEKVTMR